MKMTTAGLRNTYVTFYRPTISGQNASGEDIVSDVLLGTAWVMIRSTKGTEEERNREKVAIANFKITMGGLEGFTLQRKDYIAWGSPTARRLEIVDVEDVDQTKAQVLIFAMELAT